MRGVGDDDRGVVLSCKTLHLMFCEREGCWRVEEGVIGPPSCVLCEGGMMVRWKTPPFCFSCKEGVVLRCKTSHETAGQNMRRGGDGEVEDPSVLCNARRRGKTQGGGDGEVEDPSILRNARRRGADEGREGCVPSSLPLLF